MAALIGRALLQHAFNLEILSRVNTVSCVTDLVLEIVLEQQGWLKFFAGKGHNEYGGTMPTVLLREGH